jgi:anti-sigma factor RsiW
MSHLGELTSALVDGELTGAELDRANAHLAACDACRTEAAQLRTIKRELRALAEVAGAEALTRRLLAMPGPKDPLGPRPLLRAQGKRARRRRGRYMVLGAVSLVVAGVGAAAFGMGGGGAPTERQITPQLEMFDLQHAVTSGDIPFTGSQKAVTRKTPGKVVTKP